MKSRAEAALDNLSQGGRIGKIRIEQQQKMLYAFKDFKGSNPTDKILDIALFPSTSLPHACSLIEMLPAKERDSVTSCKILPSSGQSWRTIAGNMQVKNSEADQKLPFGDGEFEWVFCNLALEHAGAVGNQSVLLQEIWRVASKGIFVTAGNKRHPIDFNSGLPLLHWLPSPAWERTLRQLGKRVQKDEHIPNLLDAATLEDMAQRLPGSPTPSIGHIRFFGVKAHFFLMAQK